MKRIIDGKKYDTETAECLGEYDNGLFGNDFRRVAESLYRKKTGEFFIYGDGGPMSIYAVCEGNSTSGSVQIVPINEIEARNWAEEHLDGDDYEEIFGEVEE